MKNTYAQGQREFAEWLKVQGVRLTNTVEHGLQTRDGWDCFVWTLTVSNSRHAGDSESVAYDFPYMQGTAHTKRPTAVDIVSSLLSDASCVAGETFEGFCANLGYDTDSKKADDTYRQIQVNNGRLLRLFRETNLDRLLTDAAPRLEKAGL